MQINITLDTDDLADLRALTALVDTLGGRLPAVTTQTNNVHVAADFAERFPNGKGMAEPGEPDGSGDADGGAAGPSTTANASDLDASGLPWDERIHSGNREKNAGDGLWRKRRGVAQELVDSVTAELRGTEAPAAPAVDPTPPASLEPSTPPAPPPPPAADTAPASSDVTNAVSAPPPPPAPEAPAAGNTQFANFPAFIKAVNDKDVPAEKKVYAALTPIANMLGVGAFPLMKDHPDMWQMFYDMVGA